MMFVKESPSQMHSVDRKITTQEMSYSENNESLLVISPYLLA